MHVSDTNAIFAFVGLHQFNPGNTDVGEPPWGEHVAISELTIHPSFDRDLVLNDIALLKLQTPVRQFQRNRVSKTHI